MRDLNTVRAHFKEKGQKYEEKAENASTEALREFYKGRAAEARAAASSLSKFLFDPEQNKYRNGTDTD